MNRIISTLILVFLCLPGIVQAQEPSKQAKTNFELKLPSLDSLMVRIKEQSPTLHLYQALTRKRKAELQEIKLSWTEGINARISSQYGSYGNEALDQISIGMTAGVTFQLSVFDLVGLRKRKASAVHNLDAARHKEEEAAFFLTQRVTELYHEVQLGHRLVLVKNETLQATQLQLELAEEAFAQGSLSVSELAKVTQIASKAATEYEVARNQYLESYAQLEVWAGCSLHATCR